MLRNSLSSWFTVKTKLLQGMIKSTNHTKKSWCLKLDIIFNHFGVVMVLVGQTEFCRQNSFQSTADLTPIFQITNWIRIAHIFCKFFLLCSTTSSCRWEVPELLAGFQSQDVHFPFQCRLEAKMGGRMGGWEWGSVGKHSRNLLVLGPSH